MSRKGKNYYDNYDYLTEETIRKASEGDSKALSDVILRYMNYGRKCFRTLATTKYGRDPETAGSAPRNADVRGSPWPSPDAPCRVCCPH